MNSEPNLQGLRILNTRPAHQAKNLSDAIKTAQGQVIECPTLLIQPTSRDWLKTLPDLNQVDLAIFVSANAVYYFFKSLADEHLTLPAHIKVIAIGEATAKALQSWTILVTATPAMADSEHLLSMDIIKGLSQATVLLCKGDNGRPLIEDELKQHGMNLIPISVYRREMPTYDPKFIKAIWQNDLVDIILITSQQSLQHLFSMFGNEAEQWLKDKTYLVLSERLASIARSHGITKVTISQPDDIINTLNRIKHGEQQ